MENIDCINWETHNITAILNNSTINTVTKKKIKSLMNDGKGEFSRNCNIIVLNGEVLYADTKKNKITLVENNHISTYKGIKINKDAAHLLSNTSIINNLKINISENVRKKN